MNCTRDILNFIQKEYNLLQYSLVFVEPCLIKQ